MHGMEHEGRGMTHRRAKHKEGGAAKEEHDPKPNVYNAKGSPEVKEAEDEEEDFGKGGKVKKEKRAHGGKAEGEHAMERADRMPRGKRAHGGKAHETKAEERREEDRKEHKREHDADGGRTGLKRGGRASSGHSPYSSGRHTSDYENGSAAQRGMEGQKVPSESG